MPKQLTFPILLDEVPQLTIKALLGRDLLNDDSYKKSSISWAINGQIIATITVYSFVKEKPYIVLSYNYQGKSKEYRVNLVSRLSNLGRGKYWYFVCPVTKKNCRTLYCVNGDFLHREAFKNIACYKTQTESKDWRELRRKIERFYSRDEVYKELYSKHFKKFYKGQPTRRYLQLMKKIDG